jgi:hypothetical protein
MKLTLEELIELRVRIDSAIDDVQRGAIFLNRRPISIEEKQFFKVYDMRVGNFLLKKIDLNE